MKIDLKIYQLVLAGFMLILPVGCVKETPRVIPSLTTATVSNITSTSATCGGVITSNGGEAVTSRGVCWSTGQSPKISDSKTIDGKGTGSYSSSITGLTPGTTYYIRAYATNSVGTAYGNQVTASTPEIVLATITTAPVSAFSATSVTIGGNITSDGGAPVTARGVCWSTTNQNPTIADSKTSDGTGTGSFTSSLTGLNPGTNYYIRAYATNSLGTAYGAQVAAPTTTMLAILTTTAVSAVTATTATSGGNITSDGGRDVTARGVCWSTNQNPTIADSKTSDGTGAGSFTSSITGLTPGTNYYIRAYATNSVGTAYGNQVTSTTSTIESTITTTAVSAVTATTLTSGGNITSDGGGAVTARGVCWSINQNPTISDSKTSDGTGTGSFTSSITGLNPGTNYYIRAYATNSAGTAYGNQVTATTTTILATITTTAVSAVTGTTVTSGGNITNDGGGAITARGVCWSTNQNPTIADSKTSDGTGTGSFASSITGLSPVTTYYIRAYATNSAGTAYGNEVTVTIPATLATITTTAISAVTETTVTSGGNIASDGGAPVTARGVCWSTNQNPTIADSKTSDGTGTGSFTSSITGLTPGTTYYIRVYATNSVGTAYGNQVTTTTLALLPTIAPSVVSAVTTRTINISNNITSDGGAPVTARGVCWSTTQNPTIANSKTLDGTGTGLFTSSITGLTPGATYYIRAYATNSRGTAYGDQLTATTQAILATITTTEASAVTATTITTGGNITSDGGAPVTARGVCWSTSQNPTITDSKTSDGTGTGSFTSSISGLTSGTTYYIRAYATNSVGTSYGAQIRVITVSPDSFIITIKTDNPGSSGSTGITIPTSGSGYIVTIDWGDASANNYSGTPGNITHTYSSSGTFVVRISGTFPTIKFNNGGDKLKLLSIEQWGNNIWSTFNSSFYGCTNLVINATDLPNSGSVADFSFAWTGCTGLTSFPLINTSAGTNFGNTWNGCTGLTSFPLIDTSAGTNFSNTWTGCTGLTSFPLINTSSGISFLNTWAGCTGLTLFPTLNMNKMTYGNGCFSGVTLPTVIYSNLLIDLNTNNSNNGVTFDAGLSKYNSSAVGARTSLSGAPRNWVITDGGLQ